MCNHHYEQGAGPSFSRLNRRHFLTSVAAVGAALTTGSIQVSAKEPRMPEPREKGAEPPEVSLRRLMEGNKRYIQGSAKAGDFFESVEALEVAQFPFAAILGCSDSRVAPEIAFDTGLGDLFVVRVAGNVVTPEGIASLEFTTAELGTPLIMVLGHSNCGAVEASIQSIDDGKTLPGSLPSLVELIKPAVEAAKQGGGDLLDRSIRQNVLLGMKALTDQSDILKQRVDEGKLKIVGGIYDLHTGEVHFVA
ncbi:carbonic anhydrase [Pseudovibrio flavus]|uniref:carbonic anhydrase n=1 Tax=Pseudovibrio flavus TaxID=2529854 RepID=UPI00211C9390|nr:carbonic anhydrase [Pseudovibrio flavus]